MDMVKALLGNAMERGCLRLTRVYCGSPVSCIKGHYRCPPVVAPVADLAFAMLKYSRMENTKWKNICKGKQRKDGTWKGRRG